MVFYLKKQTPTEIWTLHDSNAEVSQSDHVCANNDDRVVCITSQILQLK